MSSKQEPTLILEPLGPGCFYLQAPSVGLKMLCGSPPDAIKLLSARGHVQATTLSGYYAESGPNAILLNDRLTQAGEICNLTEFPVLHMLYKQGMAIPGHPNHQAQPPLLIGKSSQLTGQAEYLKRGNYGLYDLKEYRGLGVSVSNAKMHLDLKEQFAYGQFLDTSELMNLVSFDQPSLQIQGLTLTRAKTNHFKAELEGEEVQFSLDLPPGESYRTSYELPAQETPSPRFGVLHIGEGDGWDTQRPCLNTVVIAGEHKYLIDAGPFVSQNLQTLGIDPTSLAGLCVTHVHDDHFGGFYNLIQQDPNLKIFATPRVFSSLVKKYCALIGETEESLRNQLNFEPLTSRKWNSIGDLMIKPIPSAHPIDTTLLLFRMKTKGRYKTYGHLADIVSLSHLCTLVSRCRQSKAALRLQQQLIKVYQLPLDLKKVDIGGDPIHGQASDFSQDTSKALLLSHTSTELPLSQQTFGRQPKFGDLDILIP